MMRMLKRIIGLIFASALFIMPITTAYAATNSPLVNGNGVVQPNYVPECGSYATHDMLSAGWGDIYNTTTGKYVFSWGACFQCTRCNLVLVCQNEPNSGNACGYWTTYQPGEPLTAQYTIIRQSSNNIYYESSSSIYGCTFRYRQYKE